MRLKHWQGYGTVDVKKLSMTKDGEVTTLKVIVTGNHEWGICTNDDYTVANWLVKRFDKNFDYYRSVMNIQTMPGYADDNTTETCVYEIKYRNR